jgi:CBS domain containing-hemolysin-like protein
MPPRRFDSAVNEDALLWLTVAGTLAAALFAVGARALREFSRRELQEICLRHEAPDRFGDILRHHEHVALGAKTLEAFAAVLAVVAATLWLQRGAAPPAPAHWWHFPATVLAFGLAACAAAVWLPWWVARVAAAPLLYLTWPFWRIAGRLTFPLIWCAGAVDRTLHRLLGRQFRQFDEAGIEEEIRSIVTEGHREGLLEEEAREMIEGVMELRGAVVTHIMTPRTEMHTIQVDTPWEELVDDVINSGCTRVPVYGKSRDDIIGILHSKDLLTELAKGADEPRRPLMALLRKPLFVPESKPIDELLALFQQSRTHIAVVLDEYGGVAGLVTIEDALEEIVGDIVDEYDTETEVEIHKLDNDVCEALGRAHVDEINAEMGFDLPEKADYDTIGGFVFAEFGRVPAAGESLTWQDSVRVTVLEATRRRVNRVRLERVRQESLEIA